MAEGRLGIGRACPHCGVRSDTLGAVCPACRKPYGSAGALERPLWLWVAWVAMVGAAIWLLFTHLVAGILLLGAAFVALVAGIGISNALTDRGR